MIKKTKNIKKNTENNHSGQRPCDDCLFFRRLGGRFGVCDRGEHPSDPRDCKYFRKSLNSVD